jgi:hypothetical protein
MTVVSELISGFEGYAPTNGILGNNQSGKGVSYHAYTRVKNTFSIVYKQTDHESGLISSFSFFLTKQEAISLKTCLDEEVQNRSVRSNTYYDKNVYLTSMYGSLPVISLVDRGLAFNFRFENDYDELLRLLNKYLREELDL